MAIRARAQTVAPATQPGAADLVTLDFPDEIELQALVDYASQTLGVNILYDQSLRSKKVSLRSPASVPKGSLLGLVRSVLRSQGLALVEDDHAGWLRVVQAQALPSHVREIRLGPTTRPGADARVVTQIVPIQHAELSRVASTIKPFLTTPGGTATPVEGSRLLILTDYEATLTRVLTLIDLMDVASPSPTVEIVPARHHDATALAARVSQIVADKARFADPKGAADGALTVTADAASQTITLIGLPEQVAEARSYLERFDTASPTTATTRVRYTPHFVNAARVKSLIEQVLLGGTGGTGKKPDGRHIFVDADSNTLYVTATQALHAEIRTLIDELDDAPPESSQPMRFYTLRNRRAADVFETIAGLLGDGVASTTAPRAQNDRRSERSPVGGLRGRGGAGGGITGAMSQLPGLQPRGRPTNERTGSLHASGADYKLTVDEATNTLIVSATVEQHSEIEKLIARLDKRRPQVLIELTLIAITASDSLSLGIELEALDLGDPTDYLLYSAFGLSGVDPVTGARTPTPGLGFNGVLIAPDSVPILMQALETKAHARTLAAPRILVIDNGTGTLSSVDQAPFTSLNASDTVATTSFAGFADAGTTVTVSPQITEGDHLLLDYQLTFSSFTGAASGVTAPPPRSSTTISSTIEVPDGYTVIVGGLLVESPSVSRSQIPGLGDLPLLGALFQSRSQSESRSRVYAFIRPTILRDDGFEDLKLISAEQAYAAGLNESTRLPGEPMWMH